MSRMDSVVLQARWYDSSVRERVRQLALWSASSPVLLYQNCGLPPQGDPDGELAAEVRTFQDEQVLRLWGYQGEDQFEGSTIATFVSKAGLLAINNEAYGAVLDLVDSRSKEHLPSPQELGYRNMEGMLLEEAVLRRRYFSQGIAGALDSGTIADSETSLETFTDEQLRLFEHSGDVLTDFFRAIGVPSLVLLDHQSFLELRQKSQPILREIVSQLQEQRVPMAANPISAAKRQTVDRLVAAYEQEVRRVLKQLATAGRNSPARQSLEKFADGSLIEMQAKLDLFSLGSEVQHLVESYLQDAQGRSVLVLMVLDWRLSKTRG